MLTVCLIAGTMLVLTGCDEDEQIVCYDCCLGCPPQDLTAKWRVLSNLEDAYNRRRIDNYDDLLDENFTFFLSAADVGNGLPAQWDRAMDVTSNTNLFAADPPDPFPRCKDIDMDVRWEDEEGKPNVAWVEIDGPNGEKWYTTTVYYAFQIDVEPDMTYINNPGAKAQFTVRNAGTEEAPLWKLVEMHDLGDPELTAHAASSTESSTWGSI